MDEVIKTVHVDTKEVDMVLEKTERLVELLKEAKTLSSELASMKISLEINV